MARHTPLDMYRNIGIMAHIDAGKTTTTERILYYTGKQHKIGEVHEGTATMDWMEQEQERGITITSAATTAFWTRHGRAIQGLGPSTASTSSTRRGTSTSRSKSSVRFACSTVPSTLLDSVAGVEPQTETVWRQADRYGVPRIIFANKMDRVGANFDRCVAMIRDRLSRRVVPAAAAGRFGRDVHGPRRRDRAQAVHLRRRRRWARTSTVVDVPAEFHEAMEAARHEADRSCGRVRRCADREVSRRRRADRRRDPVARSARRRSRMQFVPVLCGASFKNKGVQALLDAVIDYLPSPLDIPADQGSCPDDDERDRSSASRRMTRRSPRSRSRS